MQLIFHGYFIWHQWEIMHLIRQRLNVPWWGIHRRGPNLSEEKGDELRDSVREGPGGRAVFGM